MRRPPRQERPSAPLWTSPGVRPYLTERAGLARVRPAPRRDRTPAEEIAVTHPMPYAARCRALAALLAAAALVLLACSRAPKRDAGSDSAADSAAAAQWLGPLPIRVVNRYSLDVTVFAVVNGQRRRLGLVNTAGSGVFEIPVSLLAGGATLRLRAEPVGRKEGVTTEALSVQPGQRVEWMIESGLERSTVGVY